MAAEHSDSPPEQTRRRFRLGKWGLVLRVAIYVPLIAFFGWRAAQRFQIVGDTGDDLFRDQVDERLESPPDVIMLPNGEPMRVISPEQAKELGIPVKDQE